MPIYQAARDSFKPAPALRRRVRQRDLELLLSRVPGHPAPRADLEQVATPAPLAADLLYRALALGDVADRRVLDLGCGTGVFAIGALLLGAREAVAVDLDAAALAVARAAAERAGVAERLVLVEADVATWTPDAGFDVAIQNPPFGAQKRGADRPFLEKALAAARVAYSMHLTETGDFVLAYARARGAEMTHAWDYAFPVRHLFRHHERASATIPVTAFRFVIRTR